MFSLTWIAISSLSLVMVVAYIKLWLPQDVGKAGKAKVELAMDRFRNEDNWKKMVFMLLFLMGMLPVGTILCLADAIVNN